jgi:hypothetical protein
MIVHLLKSRAGDSTEPGIPGSSAAAANHWSVDFDAFCFDTADESESSVNTWLCQLTGVSPLE